MKMTQKEMADLIQTKLSHQFSVQPATASDEYMYKALSMVITDLLVRQNDQFNKEADKQGKKRVYYLCMEFLMGRSLRNSLFNMGLEDTVRKVLAKWDCSLDAIYEQEPDPGLGNGGLGRLAACYLDGLASGGYPAMGYSLRYEYGIFRQKLVDGWQTELPDFWLPGGEVWLVPHRDLSLTVNFDGHIVERWDGSYHTIEHRDATSIIAVPYDIMVAGKDGKGTAVLRLWSAQSPDFDMSQFNEGNYLQAVERNAMAETITKVLYPSDNHPEGKSLRLRQQYFLVSASIQDIFFRHLKQYNTVENLADMIAIHINDTHPALAIPELMRLLLDECGYSWDTAWNMVTKIVAYTNHTVMKEALECWSEDLFRERLPRIYQIVKEIDNRYRGYVWSKTGSAEMVSQTAIIEGGVVRMANLCVAASHCVNGVSALHSDILTDTIFKNFYQVDPQKFTNVTNGIAHRRWLCQANPELNSLLKELIGDGFVNDASNLKKFAAYRDDSSVLDRLGEIKLHNKQRIAKYIEVHNGVKVDPNSLFDVQVKRLHEYKRQHLNALHIISQYLWIKDHPNADFAPHTYIFGAKAAPGYFLAKRIILMINEISRMIAADPAVRDKLKVIYLEDYRVSLAEQLIPAAEISEQISLAGTEASGTSNMKFMLNGAVTLGTLDGANVEIYESVGDDNMILFGMTTPEAVALKNNGYYPQNYVNNNPRLKAAVDMLNSGINGTEFRDIAASLTTNDPYMVMADFEDYCRAQEKARAIHADPRLFNQMSLSNIANAGRFASDRSVKEYADNIWHITPVKK